MLHVLYVSYLILTFINSSINIQKDQEFLDDLPSIFKGIYKFLLMYFNCLDSWALDKIPRLLSVILGETIFCIFRFPVNYLDQH